MAYFRASTGSGSGGEGQIVLGTGNCTTKQWIKITLGFKPRMFIFKANSIQPMHEYDVVNNRFTQSQGGNRTDVTSTWIPSQIRAVDDGVEINAPTAYYSTINYIAVE